MNTTPLHELYLAGIGVLSLILPLMASALALKNPSGAKPWLLTVWAGQLWLAFGGLLVIFSPLHPSCGLAVAAASCLIFGWRLRRQLRPAPIENC